jgi:hypothetical protein
MSYQYGEKGYDAPRSAESEPYLANSQVSESSHHRLLLVVGGVCLIYTAVSIILLIVFAFSNNTLFPNLSMVLLLLFLLSNVFALYKWSQRHDPDDSFRYIMILEIVILILASTVGIIYATGVNGECEELNCEPCASWKCDNTDLFMNATQECYPSCLYMVDFLLNLTVVEHTPLTLAAECVECG